MTPDLTLTRIHLAEHSYPQPTRNHLSQQQRDRAKARVPAKPRASELRFGYRAKDGTTYMFPTASELEAYRAQDRANRIMDKQLAAERLTAIVTPGIAEVDSWAHKS